ncbi:MAG: GNAT family N-acetyltransferase [Mycobacterium leprae]
MYWYRMWQASDLPWLQQAMAVAAWESLSPAERLETSPQQVAMLAFELVSGTLSTPAGTAILALHDREPVGFILMAVGPDPSTDEPQGFLLIIWVAPAHRRHGLARSLEFAAEGVLRTLGMRKVKICPELHNEAALRLAAASGFQPEGIIGQKSLE